MSVKITKRTITLAVCIALLPPVWAVLAPYFGIRTGAVALICAGLYVTNNNKREDAGRISLGFLLGDCWAFLAVSIMDFLSLNPDLELFYTLCILGMLAVLISAVFEYWIFCPAWLCGWAIGLTIMTMIPILDIGSYFIQIAAAMFAGVWYIGVFLNYIHIKMMRIWKVEK